MIPNERFNRMKTNLSQKGVNRGLIFLSQDVGLGQRTFTRDKSAEQLSNQHAKS